MCANFLSEFDAVKTTPRSRQLALTIIALILFSGEVVTKAQALKSPAPYLKKDTVSVFSNRLKIRLAEGSFEKMPAEVSAQKYASLFNLHDISQCSGFVLHAKDTLVFYMTSIDRPSENDGGISTWEVINSFMDRVPAYRMESGWNKLGRDYLYFVKLVPNAKPDHLFEFNFFFIDNKLVFSLLQRPIKALDATEQQAFTLITAR